MFFQHLGCNHAHPEFHYPFTFFETSTSSEERVLQLKARMPRRTERRSGLPGSNLWGMRSMEQACVVRSQVMRISTRTAVRSLSLFSLFSLFSHLSLTFSLTFRLGGGRRRGPARRVWH